MYWYVVHRCILVKVSNEQMKLEHKDTQVFYSWRNKFTHVKSCKRKGDTENEMRKSMDGNNFLMISDSEGFKCLM